MDSSLPFSSLVANLDMVQTFAQEVHASLDPLTISQSALNILNETFHPLHILFYWADPVRHILRLLGAQPESNCPDSEPLPTMITYDTPSLIAEMHRERNPILISDLQDPALKDAISLESCFRSQNTRGCLCLPLWCGSSFEGCLLVTFTNPLAPTDIVAQTLLNCGLHLAAACSNARLHQTTEDERVRQRAILDQLPEGILITEAVSGLISYVNKVAAHILDMPFDKLLASPLHLHTSDLNKKADDTWPRVPWTFAVIRALGGETVSHMEAIALRPNGARVPVLCSSSPLYTKQGIITGAILVFQDITVQKSLEAQKNLFFSFASHELRTPLTAVLGYAEILHEIMVQERLDQMDLPSLQIASQHILVQAEQMTHLLDEMLDLARMDHAQLVMHPMPINLISIVKHVVEMLRATTNKHQLQLKLEGYQINDQLMIMADAIHLTQAINNLINNAIKYSPQGGEIEIGVRSQKAPLAQVILWVKDQGLGIAKADLPHLFTRFYRAQNVDSAISGLGIGLHLVKEIIERHNGQIQVESTEGQGSLFIITLPLPDLVVQPDAPIDDNV